MRCATRGRLVDSGSGFNAPALLPGHGPATRRPLPSAGSSRHEFPGFTGTMGRSDSRPSVPSHFVAFARRLPPRAPVFVAPRKPDAGTGPVAFEMYKDRGGKVRFRLKQADELLAMSAHGYATR